MKSDENTQTHTQIAFTCLVNATFSNSPNIVSSSLVVVNRCVSQLVVCEPQPAAQASDGLGA